MTKIIPVYDLINTKFAVSPDDGQIVYNVIKKGLDNEKVLNLSFENLKLVDTSFLNVAIGQLLSEYTKEFIEKNISYSNIEENDEKQIQAVIDNAITYFKNKEKIDEIEKKDILGE